MAALALSCPREEVDPAAVDLWEQQAAMTSLAVGESRDARAHFDLLVKFAAVGREGPDQVQQLALKAMGNSKHPDAYDAIVPYLNTRLRTTAIAALGMLQDERACADLARLWVEGPEPDPEADEALHFQVSREPCAGALAAYATTHPDRVAAAAQKWKAP